MPNTDRNHKRALIALGMSLCAIVFVAWLSQEPYNTKTGYRAPQDEYGQDGNITRLVSAIERFDPWQDTFAQWLMAGLSVVATGISAWAVILVRDSLSLNRQAVKAAEDAVTEARRIGEAQVRAYVGPPRVEATIETVGGSRRFSIKGYLSNSGNSPALFPTTSCCVSMGDEVVNMLHAPLVRDIAAGESDFCFIDQGAPYGVIDSSLHRGGELTFEGVIEYDTVFPGVRKKTSFHLSLSKADEDDGPFRIRMNGRMRDGNPITHSRD